jgi:hypothetical protein
MGEVMHLPASFPVSETDALDLLNKNRYLDFPKA